MRICRNLFLREVISESEFDKDDDFNILARRISEVTADITEHSQLTGRSPRPDTWAATAIDLGMSDECRLVWSDRTPLHDSSGGKEMRVPQKRSQLSVRRHTENRHRRRGRLVDLSSFGRNAVYQGLSMQ